MRDQIEARMGTLREELQRADEELSKLRPRVGYLEQMMLRLDGALTALQGILDEPVAPAAEPPAYVTYDSAKGLPVNTLPHPVAS